MKSIAKIFLLILIADNVFSQNDVNKDVLFKKYYPASDVAELYIKNEVEQHLEGKFSEIKIYPIYNEQLYLSPLYLEFDAYKYAGTKNLVLLCGTRVKDPQSNIYSISKNVILSLTEEQCKSLNSYFKELVSKMNSANNIKNETSYVDYTVSKDLFIGFEKSNMTVNPTGKIYLYINGLKYQMSSDDFMKVITVFLNY